MPTPEDYAFSRLSAYAAITYPSYQLPDHIRLIARKLEAVERGDIRRLMIFMPPRHGKSMLVSEFFPAWYLGRNPEHYVIASSYAQELAEDFGRKVRNQLLDPVYQSIFPGVGARTDSTSAKRFHTTQNGVYYAVGVGGAITGRGANLLLIDDPIKNREDAESETIRRKMKDWYTSTAYTRLMPDARVVIINTRWHEDDLSGWLQAEHKHENWDVVCLPAIRGDKALWPEFYSLERLQQIKQSVGLRDWSALYQQSPAPEEGDYFKRDWFRWYEKKPEHLRIYGASDYAVTADGGDYTVHLVAGLDPDDNLYILEMYRAQADSMEWVEAFIDLVKKWKPVEWAEENGQIIKGVGPFIDKRQRETQAYVYRKQFASAHDKPTRAQAIRGRMAQGKVYFPKDAPWMDQVTHELLHFPTGKNDDVVDAFSLLGRMLAEMVKAKEPEKPEEPRWHMTFNEMRDAAARKRRSSEFGD